MTRVRKNLNQVDLFPFLGKEKIPYEFYREEDLAKINKPDQINQLANNLGFNTHTNAWDSKLTPLLEHRWLKPNTLQARPYALDAVTRIDNQNGLIILATGLGKTFIAVIQIIRVLEQHPPKKVLILAPTKPLCEQHYRTLKDTIIGPSTCFITGRTGQKKRLALWQEHQIIIATAETIREEIAKNSGVGSADQVCLLILDEVHHLTGDHAYTYLAKHYLKTDKYVQIIGLTASPDSDLKKVEILRKLLQVKPSCVIAKFDDDQDVKPYTYDRLIKPIFLDRFHTDIQKILKQKFIAILTIETNILARGLDMDLKNCLYLNKRKQVVGLKVKSFNNLLTTIQDRINKTSDNNEKKDYRHLLMTWALAMRWRTAIDRLNKGLEELARFLKRQMSENLHNPKPSRKMFIQHETTQMAMYVLMSKRLWPMDYSPNGMYRLQ